MRLQKMRRILPPPRCSFWRVSAEKFNRNGRFHSIATFDLRPPTKDIKNRRPETLRSGKNTLRRAFDGSLRSINRENNTHPRSANAFGCLTARRIDNADVQRRLILAQFV